MHTDFTNWLDPLRKRLDEAHEPTSFFFRNDDVGWEDARLFELLDTKPALSVAEPVITLPPRVAGAIRFDDVSFSYPTRLDTIALGPVSFVIQPGERVALVGPSGAGKSTVFGLILRFYDPTAGRVLIDGADIRHCDPLDLRRAVALVPQDPVIFATSVTENASMRRTDPRIGNQVNAAATIHSALKAMIPV